ncbi:MAG: STAS-like domain-containing protein [Candidatus Rokuibacteriota bacterium]
MTVIAMRDHGRRVRAGTHAQQVRDQISDALKESHQVRLDFADVESVGATFLDSTLGILVARDGVAVLRSIVFVHCSTRVEASIVSAFSQEPRLRECLDFAERPEVQRG